MDKESAEKLILRRLYEVALKEDPEYHFHLNEFAEKNGIAMDLLERIYDEFRQRSFFSMCATSWVVAPSYKAIAYCENNGLIDDDLMRQQHKFRIQLLDAWADIEEDSPGNPRIGWEKISKRIDIGEREFYFNAGFLEYGNFIERSAPFPFWNISLKGKAKVKEYRLKKLRREEFKKMIDLVDMTPQTRGHKFESLLADVIRDEGWEVDTNVKPRGKEHDIVINKENDYYLISCKWENKPTEPDPVELLGSRAQEMRCREGIFVSMFGFTNNCINEALKKGHTAEIVLFGFRDIDQIFLNETTFSDLLKEKIKQIKHKNVILLDGEIRQ